MKKIAIVLVLLTACQFAPTLQRGPAPPPELAVGTSALVAEFNPASMNNIVMCQQSDVFVSMKNAGVFDITDGTYSFIVDDKVLKPLSSTQERFSLKGKSQFNPVGGVDELQFRMRNVMLPEQLESESYPVIFQACYNYRTLASVPVCIDPDLKNVNPQKPCRAELVQLSGGQGAPVEVVSVDPIMSSEGDKVKPVFEVTVQHSGTGQVVASGGVDLACVSGKPESRMQLESYADVRVELQERELDCVPQSVRIRVGEPTTFVCESDELLFSMAEGTFSTVLTVELAYGYANTEVLPITITRLQGQKQC